MGMTEVSQEVSSPFGSNSDDRTSRDRRGSFNYDNGVVGKRFGSWFAWFPFISIFEL